MKERNSIRVLILLAILAGTVFAQPRPSLMEEVGGANLPALQIGANDLIAISVYDAPEFTRTIRVEPDGQIHLPLLTQGIQASGLVPGALEEAIVTELKVEEILVDPVVKVTVVEYHSRPISVMGAVRKPLTFQADGSVTLLEALARAEGLTADAGTEIIVSGTVQARIPVSGLLNNADPKLNLQLTGGEEVRVPEADKIFVVGNVKREGAFPVRDRADTSLLKILALADGLAPYASRIAYVYRRDLNSGSKLEIPIELEKIMSRKSPDVTLQAGDILYVPDNKNRRSMMNIIDRVTSFGVSTASGVLIWR